MLKWIKKFNSDLGGFFTEVISIVTSRKKLKQLWGIRLYSNSFYLMLSSALNALFAFIFWIIVARFYPPEDVGSASAIISAVGLLTLFSYLGLPEGLIRFLSGAGRNASPMINTAIIIGTFASIVASGIFVTGLGFWSPALLFLRQNIIYLAAFITFTIVFTVSSLVDNVFVAERRADFTLVKGIIFGLLKLPLPIALAAFFHFFGIFASWGISLSVALLFAILFFLPRAQPGYRPCFTINRQVVNDILHFSLANYFATLFWSGAVMLLPIIVVNLLGAEPNAYFYIAWSISSVLTMVPSAVSTSLFAEGSYDESSLTRDIRRSLKMVFLILVPAVILVVAIADKLLLLFGGAYAENATTLLRILAISAIPSAINVVYLAMKRVEKRLKVIVGLSAFSAVVTIGLTYVLLPQLGINGAGIAWLAAQGVVALGIVAGFVLRRPLVQERPV